MGNGPGNENSRAPCCCSDDKIVSWDARAPEPHALAAALSLAENLGPDGVDRGKSARHIDSRYHGLDSLRQSLSNREIALVRGDFVEQCWRGGHTLPKRQDLHPDAFWDMEHLFAAMEDRTKPQPRLLALSYGWLTKDHPDPEGFHLRIYAPLLRHFARHCRVNVEDLAIFIDWCSLHQAPRSPLEAAAYNRALHHVDAWYAHERTSVWLLTRMPDKNQPPYTSRGWTRFERAVAMMVKGGADAVLDFGLLKPGWRDWADIASACTVKRRPPTLPQDFASDANTRMFSIRSDRNFVVTKYREVFQRVASSMELLHCSELGWGDAEVHGLASVLPLLSKLREVDIHNNRIGVSGATALANVLSRCESLQRLHMEGNCLNREGVKILEEAWKSAGKHRRGLVLGLQRTVQQVASAPSISGPELSTVVARQAAFEARIESKLRKLHDGLLEVSDFVSPSGTSGKGAAYQTPRYRKPLAKIREASETPSPRQGTPTPTYGTYRAPTYAYGTQNGTESRSAPNSTTYATRDGEASRSRHGSSHERHGSKGGGHDGQSTPSSLNSPSNAAVAERLHGVDKKTAALLSAIAVEGYRTGPTSPTAVPGSTRRDSSPMTSAYTSSYAGSQHSYVGPQH